MNDRYKPNVRVYITSERIYQRLIIIPSQSDEFGAA